MDLSAFSATALAAGIAGNLATSIVQHQLGKLGNNPLKRSLAKLGVLEPEFEQRLNASLRRAAILFFEQNSRYKLREVADFLSAPIVGELFTSNIFASIQIDIEPLCEQLSHYVGMPLDVAPEAWPNKIEPNQLISDFVSAVEVCLMEGATDGELWLGLKVKELSASVLLLSERVDAMKASKPLFDAEEKITNTEWDEFESLYLEHQAQKFSKLVTPGVRELQSVKQNLNIAYISLGIKAGDSLESVDSEKVLRDHKHILIRGPAGSGKTTLLNWISMQCCRKDGDGGQWHGGIPIFIPLRRVTRLESGPPITANLIQYSTDERTWLREEPKNWLDNLLRVQKRAVLMIDGVDELPAGRRPAFWSWLSEFCEAYPGNRVMVTSRTLPGRGSNSASYAAQWDPPEYFIDAQLSEMSDADVDAFIEHWHDAVDQGKLDDDEVRRLIAARKSLPTKLRDPANRGIRSLCSAPLLCAMVCVLHWREEGYLPRYKVDLYEKCCDMLVEQRDLKREIPPPTGALALLTQSDKEMALQHLALEMMRNRPDGDDEAIDGEYRVEVHRERAAHWISAKIPGFHEAGAREATPDDLLNFLVERTGLLREPAGGLIDFPHRSFQEYLAACAAGAESQEDALANQATDDQWHETIMLAAGTNTGGVAFGRRLIEALIRRAERFKSTRERSQEARKTCFALALGCLENLKQHDPALRNRVLSYLVELVPPKNHADADILAVAGDAAVAHLPYGTWKDGAAETVAACARALRKIGSSSALMALRTGYVSDSRDLVAAEACLTGVIPYKEVDAVVSHVSAHTRLPDWAAVNDIQLLQGLSGLSFLSVKSQSVLNLHLLPDIDGLQFLTLMGFDLSALSSESLPKEVRHISFGRPLGGGLSFLSAYPSLSVVGLYGFNKEVDVSGLSKAASLKQCHIFEGSMADIEFARGLSLDELSLDECRDLTSIEAIRGSESLLSLHIDSCPMVSDVVEIINSLSNISSVHLGDVKIEEGEQLNCRSLREVAVHRNDKLESIGLVSKLMDVEVLSLKSLRSISNVDIVGDFVNLHTLIIEGCNNVRRIPDLSRLNKLRKLRLGDLDVRSIGHLGKDLPVEELFLDSISNVSAMPDVFDNNTLKTLTLASCSSEMNVEFLSQFGYVEELELRAMHRLGDIEGIADLGNLKTLTLRFCDLIDDLEAVGRISSLETINIIMCNNIRDISPLEGMRNLNNINLAVRRETPFVPESLLDRVRFTSPFWNDEREYTRYMRKAPSPRAPGYARRRIVSASPG